MTVPDTSPGEMSAVDDATVLHPCNREGSQTYSGVVIWLRLAFDQSSQLRDSAGFQPASRTTEHDELIVNVQAVNRRIAILLQNRARGVPARGVQVV
jgi:hypothetical protein